MQGRGSAPCPAHRVNRCQLAPPVSKVFVRRPLCRADLRRSGLPVWQTTPPAGSGQQVGLVAVWVLPIVGTTGANPDGWRVGCLPSPQRIPGEADPVIYGQRLASRDSCGPYP